MLLGYYLKKDITVSDKAYYHSVAYFNNTVYVYVETFENKIPYDLVSGSLKQFPDGKELVPMLNVFQYSPSDNEEEWRRKGEIKPVFWTAKLKREEITKYVFYHYKMEKEGCRATNKYGIIFLYEDILIMYREYPDELGRSNERTLPENNLPDYPNLMQTCMIPWDDNDLYWYVIK